MELDPEARRLLDLTREARTPNAEDKRRVERSLSRSLGLAAFSVATGAASAATAKSAPATLVLKWTLGLAVPALVVASAATYFHGRSAERQPTVVERPVADAPTVAPAPPPEPPPTAATGTAALAPAPAEPPAAPRTAPAQAKKSETLEAELDLLHDAQVKRSSDPEGALALLVTHRKRYPKSVLGLEREALRVLCLCAAGRTAEAREVARRSFKNAPRSPLKASVEESCAKP